LVFLSSCQPKGELTDADRSRIEQEILSIHQKITDAAQKADAEAMFAHILDNEGVIVQNGLFHKSRQAALDYTKAGFGGIDKIDYQFDREIVEVLSPDKALLKGSGTSTVLTNSGAEFTTSFCETAVYTLTPDGWKLLHAHHSTPAR
jgi:uncharacterized protein (TIGR02246 family)